MPGAPSSHPIDGTEGNYFTRVISPRYVGGPDAVWPSAGRCLVGSRNIRPAPVSFPISTEARPTGPLHARSSNFIGKLFEFK